jgi:hypothetical protein
MRSTVPKQLIFGILYLLIFFGIGYVVYALGIRPAPSCANRAT